MMEKVGGIVWCVGKSIVCHQCQLFFNGIPAFRFHVVIGNAGEFEIVNNITVIDLL